MKRTKSRKSSATDCRKPIRFSDVNALCHKLDGLWRISAEELENAFAENDVHGAANMGKAYETLREELLEQSNELKM
ncbi:MAG: hypothetical protein KH377_10025 [[Eubacterium] siraeum]|jgi:hypothetical protein|nr:hypothetical protein [[Eubacterium] siraeum]